MHRKIENQNSQNKLANKTTSPDNQRKETDKYCPHHAYVMSRRVKVEPHAAPMLKPSQEDPPPNTLLRMAWGEPMNLFFQVCECRAWA